MISQIKKKETGGPGKKSSDEIWTHGLSLQCWRTSSFSTFPHCNAATVHTKPYEPWNERGVGWGWRGFLVTSWRCLPLGSLFCGGQRSTGAIVFIPFPIFSLICLDSRWKRKTKLKQKPDLLKIDVQQQTTELPSDEFFADPSSTFYREDYSKQ